MNHTEVLAQIRNTATPLLPDGVQIKDLVYRPFPMGAFGRKGYTLVLTSGPERVMAAHFETAPIDEEVEYMVDKLVGMLTKVSEA